jgi:hypothetical protein
VLLPSRRFAICYSCNIFLNRPKYSYTICNIPLDILNDVDYNRRRLLASPKRGRLKGAVVSFYFLGWTQEDLKTTDDTKCSE